MDAPKRGAPPGKPGPSEPGPSEPAIASFEGPRIVVRGARTHNLRNVDIDLPRDKLVVVTGPSGSGKSSLAFDTVFAEGQRRYVQSLSVAARQHLAQLPRPDADLIEGISPAVAISQDGRARNPRSTVGTVTEILDYLRLLFARAGEVYSHRSGQRMRRHSISDMVRAVLGLGMGARLSVLAPVVRAQPGDHAELLDDLRRQGFVRVAIDGVVVDLEQDVSLAADERHDIEVYVDRLKLKEGIEARLADSLELAAGLCGGVVEVLPIEGERMRFSQNFADLEHGIEYPELTPALFSFNSPAGACPTCDGLGYVRSFDVARIVPDPSLSLGEGALRPLAGRSGAPIRKRLAEVVAHAGADMNTPWSELGPDAQLLVLEGSGGEAIGASAKTFEGVCPWLRRRLQEADKSAATGEEPEAESVATGIREFVGERTCRDCEGTRLRIEARMVKVGGKAIHELATLPLATLRSWVEDLELAGESGEVAEVVLEQVRKRLGFLDDIGLGYLSLDRGAVTLSGGESQRIRLATQVGAGLVGITYILDEPSIGLHQRDNARLIAAMAKLRDLGNTVVVVEHDEDTMRAADWVIDMGPGAGELGGTVVAAGTAEHLLRQPESLTGAFLSGRRRIASPDASSSGKRRASGRALRIRGAKGHNLQDVDARIPLGLLTCVTGVSGSGKSSLVIDTLLPEAARELNGAQTRGLPHERIEGLHHLDKAIHVDQSPIGRSARSNPATYTGIFSELRNVYAQLPEAKIRGYTAARFSFNVKGGRCEACQGEGVRRIEMHFLPDLFVTCRSCAGRRYNRETLAITMRGKSIADVLEMSVREAYEFLVAHPNIRAKLEVLRDVGLGYVRLGQSSLTLSGGEAQRIKLARELAKKSTGATLFVLDEPTTGLHFGDVELLIAVLTRLVDEGNTVVVIEHNLEVVRCADHVIDLGPEGGGGGGQIVAVGTPAQIAKVEASHTGRYLAR